MRGFISPLRSSVRILASLYSVSSIRFPFCQYDGPQYERRHRLFGKTPVSGTLVGWGEAVWSKSRFHRGCASLPPSFLQVISCLRKFRDMMQVLSSYAVWLPRIALITLAKISKARVTIKCILPPLTRCSNCIKPLLVRWNPFHGTMKISSYHIIHYQNSLIYRRLDKLVIKHLLFIFIIVNK